MLCLRNSVVRESSNLISQISQNSGNNVKYIKTACERLNNLVKDIEDFGDKEYILERIVKELNVQFNTRKQLLLKTLYAYIANSSALDDLDCFSMFGTNSFNLVWEKVCAEVMDNQLQKPIGGLRLPMPLAEQYRDMRHKKLIDLIDKPQWSGTAPNSELFVKQAEDTLIPDLISIVNVDGNYVSYSVTPSMCQVPDSAKKSLNVTPSATQIRSIVGTPN